MEESPLKTSYNPSQKEAQARQKTYERIEKMRQLKNQKMPHFAGPNGQRSFTEYIDDNERNVNGYTFSREAQGKADWQSNTNDNITRAKMRAIASSVGLKVPGTTCVATNNNGLHSYTRADILKNITKQTFLEGNPALHNFLAVWQLLGHGGLIEHEGYKTGGAKIKRVKSFDSRTGEVEVVEEYLKLDGKPFSVIINPQEFYWSDFYIRDIQNQPRVAWIQKYTHRQLELEFSKFPNFKYIKDKKTCAQFSNLGETLYFQGWKDRVEMEDDYELIRYYSLEEDAYEIWCNGVPLFRGPMLWGDKEKYYPFAKSISEPFANTEFFWGMAFPHVLEAYAEQRNDIINSLSDKLRRAVDPAWLIGLQNKDLFDAESEWEGSDGRYYVPDVNAVKPIPVPNINQAELAFLQVIDRSLEGISIDRAQQGLQSTSEKTLGEIQIADQKARELKSMLYLFIEDHWLQRTKLRTRNILTHYLKDKATAKDKKGQIITVPDYSFPGGERGTLDIHVSKSKNDRLPETEIEAREAAAEQMGDTYKIVSMPMDYMDGWHFEFQIVPDSFHEQDKMKQEADFQKEVTWLTTFNPELFVANKDEYTREVLAFRGKNLDDMNPPAPPAPPAAPGMDPSMAPEGAMPPEAAPMV